TRILPLVVQSSPRPRQRMHGRLRNCRLRRNLPGCRESWHSWRLASRIGPLHRQWNVGYRYVRSALSLALFFSSQRFQATAGLSGGWVSNWGARPKVRSISGPTIEQTRQRSEERRVGKEER